MNPSDSVQSATSETLAVSVPSETIQPASKSIAKSLAEPVSKPGSQPVKKSVIKKVETPVKIEKSDARLVVSKASTQSASKAAPAKKPVKAVAKKAQPVKPTAVVVPVSKKAEPVAKAKKTEAAQKPVQTKAKLVRDSFTLPESDHGLIKQCKKVAVSKGRETKKSEVMRAAIQVFSALPVSEQMAAYAKLSAIAVGRPKNR